MQGPCQCAALPVTSDNSRSISEKQRLRRAPAVPIWQKIWPRKTSTVSKTQHVNCVKAARFSLEQKLGREPTISEISAETGIETGDIAAAEIATGPAESLQKESGDDGFTLELVLADFGEEERMVEHVALRAAIDALPEKERMVVALRYYHGMTQEAAARVLKVSQVQVSRLERRAVEELKKILS